MVAGGLPTVGDGGGLQRRRRVLCAGAALALAGAGMRAAAAPSYPSRVVRLVVPQAVGGSNDLLARLVADHLEPLLGVAVVVDNRAGASGAIGCEAVARAAPDGYTLLAASSNTHAMAPHVVERLPYDPLRDFAPIVNLASTVKLLLVAAALPPRTLGEFVAYARARPGELNYASAGVGSSQHLDTELFKGIARVDLVHVPYRGSIQGLVALRTGEVQVALNSVGAALPYLRGGEVRALAVFGGSRSPLLPDVPTASEAGLDGLDRVDLRTWTGLAAPAGTRAEVVDRLNRDANRVLAQPAVADWLRSRGLEPIGGTAEAFARQMRTDYEAWARLVRQIGLRAG